MKNTNSNQKSMSQLQFTLTTINPKKLQLDPLLSKMGFDKTATDFLKAEFKSLGLVYERPIVDTENNILTHSDDVMMAKEDNAKTIEVYIVKLNEVQKMRLIALKHRYSMKNLAASYEISQFFKTYMTDNPEGIEFAQTLPGNSTRQKVAGLLNTSDTTIKRLWYVGDNLPDEFGLISENNSSLKEAEEKIKLMSWNKSKPVAFQPAPVIKNEEKTVLPVKKLPVAVTPSAASPTALPIMTAVDLTDTIEEKETGNYYLQNDEEEDPIDTQCQDATNTSYSFSDGYFNVNGMGKFTMSVSDNIPQLSLNGKILDNAQFLPLANLNPTKYANVNSFVFQENNLKGLNVQIIISNFKK